MILCVLFFSPVSHSKICQPLPFKETQRIKECLISLNQNGAIYIFFYNNPNTALCENMCCCEMHVLYTPSCSKIQARYITLHLSCQTHWTHADFGSTEVVQCISNTMPHSFGIHQSTDNNKDESINKKKICCQNFYKPFQN